MIDRLCELARGKAVLALTGAGLSTESGIPDYRRHSSRSTPPSCCSVVGSSLAVYSGYRFLRRAVERGTPIAIVNRGPVRGEEHAGVKVEASTGVTLAALATALG